MDTCSPGSSSNGLRTVKLPVCQFFRYGTNLTSQPFALSRRRSLRRFRPELWAKVIPELDRAASAIARQQQGMVSDSRTITIAGERARRYDVAYTGEGKQLVERIAFVLRGKREYLLLCRYERGGDTEACDGLLTSFKLAAA